MVFLIYRTRAEVQPTLNSVLLYGHTSAMQYVDTWTNLSSWYPHLGGKGGKEVLPDVANVCTDQYLKQVLFDLTYASLSQLKLNDGF